MELLNSAFVFCFQYALHTKRENAHDESIWTCCWGRLSVEVPAGEGDADKGEDEDKENQEAAGNVTTVETDIVVTGGMDDLVRVWEYTSEGELRLKHKLAEHSLGVVSVNLTKDAKREQLNTFGRLFGWP